MHFDWIAILSGFAVGVVVGLTGVGGGSLMTPLLIGMFRLSPVIAIGTDLWFAAITKSSGMGAHHRLGNIDYRIAGLLLLGSLPATLATVTLMHIFSINAGGSSTLTYLLALALLLTAISVAYRQAWQAVGVRLEEWLPAQRRTGATVVAGALLGTLVSLTSIGGGALGATFLVLLYPRLSNRRVVGTDIAHAVPLTLAAAIGHASLGNVHWLLLGSLLLGSLPGIWLGASLTRLMPERFVRAALCISLLMAGLKVVI
jgi:uncharacterized protein